MALPRTVESIEEVDEKFREAYVESDKGGFILDIEGVDNVDHLRNAYEKVKEDKKQLAKRAKEAENQLKALEGIDPEQYRELVDLKERIELEKLESEGEYKKALQTTEEKYKTTLSKERDKYTSLLNEATEKQQTLMQQLEQVQLVEKGKTAMIKSGVLAEDVDDVWSLTSKYFQLGEDAKPVVLDDDGNPTSLTIDEFYDNVYKERKPKFYASKRKGGGGSPTGNKEPNLSDSGSTKLTREQLQRGEFDLMKLSAGQYEIIDE